MEIVDLSTLPDSETRYTEFLKQVCEKGIIYLSNIYD